MRTLEITISGTLLLIGIALFAMTFSSAFDVPTFGGDVGPAFAPRGYLAVWIVLSLTAVLQATRSEDKPLSAFGDIRRLVNVTAVGLTTGFAMLWLGFVFAAIPGLFAFAWMLGYRKLPVLLVVSICVPLAIWYLFVFGFELLLPSSPWFARL